MLKAYLKKIHEVASRGDARVEIQDDIDKIYPEVEKETIVFKK